MNRLITQTAFVDSGADGKLKLTSAMNYMMNCCQFQEYQEPGFCQYLQEQGIAVFLHSIQLDLYRMPNYRETVETTVKIYDCRPLYGLRRIVIRDEAGKICIMANATGAFFSLSEKKAVKVDPAGFKVQFDTPEPMECLPRKIPVPDTPGETTPDYPVMPSRLDPNGHLTSPEYIAVAQDRLPEDFVFNRVRIEYKKQSCRGEILKTRLFRSDPGRIVAVIQGEDETTRAVVEFSRAELPPAPDDFKA